MAILASATFHSTSQIWNAFNGLISDESNLKEKWCHVLFSNEFRFSKELPAYFRHLQTGKSPTELLSGAFRYISGSFPMVLQPFSTSAVTFIKKCVTYTHQYALRFSSEHMAECYTYWPVLPRCRTYSTSSLPLRSSIFHQFKTFGERLLRDCTPPHCQSLLTYWSVLRLCTVTCIKAGWTAVFMSWQPITLKRHT